MPLRGKTQIALRVGKIVGKFRMAKHFELEISDTHFGFARKQEAIAAEAALDGLYVIRTSLPDTAMGAEAAVAAYKSLAHVERAFRSIKTVDLQVRPVFHYNAQRVRAHVFLCMLAYPFYLAPVLSLTQFLLKQKRKIGSFQSPETLILHPETGLRVLRPVQKNREARFTLMPQHEACTH